MIVINCYSVELLMISLPPLIIADGYSWISIIILQSILLKFVCRLFRQFAGVFSFICCVWDGPKFDLSFVCSAARWRWRNLIFIGSFLLPKFGSPILEPDLKFTMRMNDRILWVFGQAEISRSAQWTVDSLSNRAFFSLRKGGHGGVN